MKQQPTLVIVPGIGDDQMIYHTFARRWRRLGYEVHVISFGWVERSAKLGPKLEAFLAKLDELSAEELYIIGVSAGGTAAVNAFAARPNVKKVIAVCSPLDTMPRLQNPLLAESIEQTRQLLSRFDSDQKARILSVFGAHDPVVDARLSQPEGVATVRLPMFIHPASIFMALMFYARKLSAFFKTAT